MSQKNNISNFKNNDSNKNNKNSRRNKNKNKREFNNEITEGMDKYLDETMKNNGYFITEIVFDINKENNKYNILDENIENIENEENEENIENKELLEEIVHNIPLVKSISFTNISNTNDNINPSPLIKTVSFTKTNDGIIYSENKYYETHDINNMNNMSNKNKNKKKQKNNLNITNTNENNIMNNNDNIKDLVIKCKDNVDYHLIQSPFKTAGEELLNDEINMKYKSKIKIQPENHQIIKKLKDTFKKLVYKDSIEKPNLSQIILDNELTEDIKLKILKKFIKYNIEDEVFSEDAEKIKIEINNLLKIKKINTSNDYDELLIKIENKEIPNNLKTRLENMYYRIISGRENKLHNFVYNVLRLPYHTKPNILDRMSSIEVELEEKIKFVDSIYKKLDENLYGLYEVKDSIISYICQRINNPEIVTSKYLCLCGPAGVGKTSIVHAISEALSIPYSYLSLANIDEVGSLIGHHYTYEGSQNGALSEAICKNDCINGIILFDEVDKCREKIQNTLLGIFDPLQNHKFRDAYFGEFFVNLSKSFMILCLNDLEKINPILKDRLHIVNISGYTNSEKKVIIDRYILPKLNKQYKINIEIDIEVINKIIESTKDYKGIRQLIMYITKIYELIILDKFTNKFNFNNKFMLKDIDHLKLEHKNTTYLDLYN